jgi:heat shock protein HtpX
VYSQIAANKRKTVFMMVLFVALVGGLGWLFAEFMGNPSITPYVLLGALIYALLSYYSSSRMALALNKAHPVEKRDNPRLYRIVENLSITDGLPTPKVYIIDDPAPNAFATGRNPQNASVSVTSGLLDMMSDSELEGVIAHELGHVKNYDIRVSMIAFALVAVISILADIMLRASWFTDDDDNTAFFVIGIIAAILAPLVAFMIQMAVSRKREYLADATGALTTRYPEGLASALEKIKQSGSVMKKQNASTAHLFFANPLKAKGLSGLFSTHPPIDDRISKLKEMGSHA